ncbi:MAG: Acyltransferase family protein [Microgenomates bacterium OLB23]|nr:MAG: Acyltransferase family protein [Microgenomates bacterium OLB23]
METAERKRLDSLDGLRGIAIILVLLNHIDSAFITNATPNILRPIIASLFSSGLNVGVAFLFILSGYLMAYIYPQPQSNLAFLQKRYTRIFPLFITMSFVMLVYRILPGLHPLLRIGVLLLSTLVTHMFWVHIIKKLHQPLVSRMLFVGFLCLQVVMAGIYALIIMRQPALVFNQLIPDYLRESVIFLVNATLTLPFGDYVPMLDGVYWTLVCEVLFYCLYPIVYVPFVKIVSQQKKPMQILFLLSLFPFYAGLTLIAENILRFHMLKLPFFIYFATGVALGHLSHKNSVTLQKFIHSAGFIANPITFCALVVIMRLSLVNASGQAYNWIVMLWSIPLTFVVASILHNKNSLGQFLSLKKLLFLGTISYSIYLSHTGIVDTLHFVYRPASLIGNVLFLIAAIALTLCIATILHNLLEKPYFARSKDNHNTTPSIDITFNRLSIMLASGLFLGTFFAYQSSFNLLSFDSAHRRESITSPLINNNETKISFEQNPEVALKIKSPEDKLGIVTAHLSYDFISNKKIHLILRHRNLCLK